MDKSKQVFNSKSELAAHLGITRKTLYKRSKELNIELSGSYTEEQLDTLRSRLGTTQVNEKEYINKHKNNQKETPNTQLVTALQEQVTYLKQQIEEKDRQIERRDQALDQQQRLQLSVSQQLDDAKEQIKQLETIQPKKKKRWWQI
jgi:transcriptional regulator of acetoin/glycerol metabolism